MSAENFTNELIASLKTNRTGEFQAKFRGADALLRYDVEFLAGQRAGSGRASVSHLRFAACRAAPNRSDFGQDSA
jgi:hypothetical protein